MPQIHLGTRQAKYAYIYTYIHGGRGQGVAALFLTHNTCSINTLTFSTFLPLHPLLSLMTTLFFPNLCPPCILWHHLCLSVLSLRFFPRRGTEKDLLGEVYWGVKRCYHVLLFLTLWTLHTFLLQLSTASFLHVPREPF